MEILPPETDVQQHNDDGRLPDMQKGTGSGSHAPAGTSTGKNEPRKEDREAEIDVNQQKPHV